MGRGGVFEVIYKKHRSDELTSTADAPNPKDFAHLQLLPRGHQWISPHYLQVSIGHLLEALGAFNVFWDGLD